MEMEESEQVAFNKLKELIMSTPVLIYLDNSFPYCIEADSSDAATRAVLSQQTSSENGGKWHPVAFFSKILSPIKWNYEIHNKEILASICALEECGITLKVSYASLRFGQTTRTLSTYVCPRS